MSPRQRRDLLDRLSTAVGLCTCRFKYRDKIKFCYWIISSDPTLTLRNHLLPNHDVPRTYKCVVD